MKERKVEYKSALPFYALGCVWLLYSIMFPLYQMLHLLICLVISLLVYILCAKIIPPKVIVVEEVDLVKSGSAYADEQIEAGRQMLLKLHEMQAIIQNPRMQKQMEEVFISGEKIYGYIARYPEKASQLIKFNQYYFPETLKILSSYLEFQRLSAEGKNISEAMEKIEKTMDTIVLAFQKQLDKLLYDQSFDVQNDIRVLEMLIQEEGLNASASFGSEGRKDQDGRRGQR